MKLEPKDCPHKTFAAKVEVNRFEDTGQFSADVTINCVDCGEPFRFIGVESGVRWDRPASSIDGLELRAPIEPEIVKKLHDRAEFHMPAVPQRH